MEQVVVGVLPTHEGARRAVGELRASSSEKPAARRYESHFREGRVLVMVRADDLGAERAAAILWRHETPAVGEVG